MIISRKGNQRLWQRRPLPGMAARAVRFLTRTMLAFSPLIIAPLPVSCSRVLGNNGSEQKIVAPQGMYHGVHANYYTDNEHLACFEQATGAKVDISQRFLNFKALSAGNSFPKEEAERMKKRGGALYLVLEPGRGQEVFDKTFPPEKIADGAYDNQLIEFAHDCNSFGGPIFISFRTPQGTPHDPEQIKKAYNHIRLTLLDGGAENITFVWYANLDDQNFAAHYPGADSVDWVAVTLYQTEGRQAADVIGKLAANIGRLKKLGQPILVEFGSDAPPAQKTEFIKTAVAKFKELGIKAFIHNNLTQYEGSILRTWSLASAKEKKAYQKAIQGHEQFLKENIITAQGELKGEPEPVPEGLNCPEIEQTFYTSAAARGMKEIRETIQEKESYLRSIVGPVQRGDPHYNNQQRIKLARAYQGLYSMTQNEDYLEKAARVLDEALESPDPVLIYHWEKKFIRQYFETLLTMANLYVQIDTVRAEEYCQKVHSALNELNGVKFFNPNQGRKESIPGFRHKALAIQAKIREEQKKEKEAAALYQEVIIWSGREAEQDLWGSFPYVWESTWFRSEDVDDVKYDGASAKISLGFAKLKKGEKEEALALFRQVLDYERVGKLDFTTKASNFVFFWLEEDKAFLDQAFAALIGTMLAYAMDNPKTAKERFNQDLPWEKINQYTALKKAFDIEDTDLASESVDRWDTILSGLTSVDLLDHLKVKLVVIKKLTKGKNK
jgi:hypothetical protein